MPHPGYLPDGQINKHISLGFENFGQLVCLNVLGYSSHKEGVVMDMYAYDSC